MTENPAVPSEPTTPSPDEPEIEAGGLMTPRKLREIADWLDTYDDLAESYLRLRRERGDHLVAAQVEAAFATIRGDGVQRDLRRWADDIARSSAGSPSPAVEKLRDERNEALAELHEANRWLWLAREQGFVPNSGAGSPSPEQIAAGEQAILASEDVDTHRGYFYADLTAREIAELVLAAARVSGPSPEQINAAAKAIHDTDCTCGKPLADIGPVADAYRKSAKAALVAACSVRGETTRENK